MRLRPGRYDVVLDGILGPYAVLRPSLDVVLSRATAREGRQLKDVEPITGLYGAFGGIGALERCSAGLAEERFLIGG